MKLLLFTPFLACALIAQPQGNDRLLAAFQERALSDQAQRMNTDERIRMYEAMAKGQPTRAHYRNLLASAYIQKVRETTDFSYLDRAGQILEGVLSEDANDYEATRLKLEVELERHNFKRAAELATRSTKIAPQDPWNYGALGDALIELGDYNAAADAYQQMVMLRPDLASYNRAAWFRFLAGDQPGAVVAMKAAIEAGSSAPENVAWCWVELGKLYWKAGQAAEAENAFQAALRRFPNYHTALAGLGMTAAAKGDWNSAITLYKKAQSSTPLPDYASALYDLYTVSGDSKEALKQKQMIDVIDQTSRAAQEKANRNMALIFADHDWNVVRALELATAELDIRKDIYTWDALAWAQYKNGKFAEASESMSKALQMETQEPLLMYHAGMIAAANGQKVKAEQLLRKALELNPKFDVRQAAVASAKLKELQS